MGKPVLFRQFSTVLLLLITSALYTPDASSETPQGRCTVLLQDISVSFEHDFDLGYAGAALPLLSRSDILSIGENIGELGRASEGVFAVETRNGSAALKFFMDGMTIEEMKVSFFLQKHLGDLGLAPKVLGVFEKTEAQALSHSPWVGAGLLMEKIEGADFLKYMPLRKDPLFYTGKPLGRTAIRKAKAGINRFAEALQHLRIYAEDIQFMIWPDGELKAIDFDFYVWKSNSGGYFGYNSSTIENLQKGKIRFQNDFQPILKAINSLEVP